MKLSSSDRESEPVLELALLLLDGGICPVDARLFLSSGPLDFSTSIPVNEFESSSLSITHEQITHFVTLSTQSNQLDDNGLAK